MGSLEEIHFSSASDPRSWGVAYIVFCLYFIIMFGRLDYFVYFCILNLYWINRIKLYK